VYSRYFRPGGQPLDFAKDFSEWEKTEGVAEPTPEWAKDLPEGLLSVRNEDNTWGIGKEVNSETIVIPGINSTENKLTLDLGDEETLDITHDIDKINIINHESGALIIDKGERIGYVWKGDHWAEILLQITFETDGMKFDEFPTVTYEDIASGALAEAERLEAQPLPEKVIPVNDYVLRTDSDYYIYLRHTSDQVKSYYADSLTKPMRFEFFYKSEINDVRLIISSLQIKNKDGSSVFLHILSEADHFDASLNVPSTNFDLWYENISLYSKPVFDLAIFSDPNASCQQPPYPYSNVLDKEVVCPINQPNYKILDELARKWVATGNIPNEFEKIIIKSGGFLRW
jgi:hypothetical protein